MDFNIFNSRIKTISFTKQTIQYITQQVFFYAINNRKKKHQQVVDCFFIENLSLQNSVLSEIFIRSKVFLQKKKIYKNYRYHSHIKNYKLVSEKENL
jgi:hypothetical protein